MHGFRDLCGTVWKQEPRPIHHFSFWQEQCNWTDEVSEKGFLSFSMFRKSLHYRYSASRVNCIQGSFLTIKSCQLQRPGSTPRSSANTGGIPKSKTNSHTGEEFSYFPRITEKQGNEKQTKQCKCTVNNRALKPYARGEERNTQEFKTFILMDSTFNIRYVVCRLTRSWYSHIFITTSCQLEITPTSWKLLQYCC